MVQWKSDGKKTKYFVCFLLLWLLQMAAAFWFCTQKQGFHEDEFYTYYSTARTNGFYIQDGEWMERETYRDEFVVLPGQRFQYGLVRQVQSWDVHPPMYYWVFHTVASLVPGVFSKWIGLSVNLFFHGINLLLLTRLSYLAAGKDLRLPLPVMFVYGFCPAVMSGVVFIRMYEMLTTFVLLCAILHVRAVQELRGGLEEEKSGRETAARRRPRLSVRMLFVMSIVTYVGFLTQYYYFIFLFFLAIGFCLWLLWRERKITNCLCYGLSQGLAFLFAYLTYSAFPGQMFRGQRGAQATENFFDLSNTLERLSFFWDLMNRYVFGGLLGLLLLFLLAAAVAGRMADARQRRDKRTQAAEGRRHTERQNTKNVRQKDGLDAVFYMLLFAAVGYFVTVSKTALLLGDTSNRYQLPIYGIVVLLLALGAERLLRRFAEMNRDGGERERAVLPPVCAGWREKRIAGVTAVFCLAVVAMSYVRADVVFLYPEAWEAVSLAGEQAAAHIPVVYVYRPGEEWCVWAVADELMEYDRVYFVSAASEEPVTEPTIAKADAVVVYLPLYEDAQEEAEQKKRILSANEKLSEGHLQYPHKYCNEWYYGGGAVWRGGGN